MGDRDPDRESSGSRGFEKPARSDVRVVHGTASLEIDQTLRLARDSVEEQIARYRVWTFAAIVGMTVVVSILLHVQSKPSTYVPTAYFAACTGYAVLLERTVRRVGARDGLIYAALALDLLAVSSLFPLMLKLDIPGARQTTPSFALHIAAPAMAFILFVNGLRGHYLASIVGAAIASVLVLVVLVPIEGFNPAQIPVALGFWVLGAVGVASARQGRRNLDNFARLQLLRRYLSPAAVERVMREHPDAALALGGRLVTVTLLSADLRGFTAMSERLTPDEVVLQLNAFHGTMLEEIERHGGVLDKFIGDGILVVFGLEAASGPPAEDAGAQRAVACGRGMLGALSRHNEDRAKRGEVPLKMGIGIHTGPVVAGNIGAPGRRLEFTVIGDAVNTAARLEGLTKQAGTPLLVSVATVERLEGDHGMTELAPMTARGKEATLRVYSLGDF
jgi:adenylate cyclase